MANRDAIVVVGVCTCRSPAGLTKLLTHLAETAKAHPPDRVIVVDNDCGGAGIRVVQMLADALPFRLTAVTEPRAGIPFARNRLIAEALKEDFNYLVMLDDDEYPAPGWLEAMVAVAKSSDADVVGGPVAPKFAAPPASPLEESDFAKQGGRVTKEGTLVFSTANVLVTRRLIARWEHNWFHPAFAETGGSDTEFLRRTARAGHSHAIAAEAIVYEDIPAERAQKGWLLRRSFRASNILAQVRVMHDGRLRAAAMETTAIAALTLYALTDIVRAPTSSRAYFSAALHMTRALGKLVGLLGVRYREYTRTQYRVSQKPPLTPS